MTGALPDPPDEILGCGQPKLSAIILQLGQKIYLPDLQNDQQQRFVQGWANASPAQYSTLKKLIVLNYFTANSLDERRD